MIIAFCGDIMPGGVLPYQQEYASKAVRALLRSADYRVGTLECAIGDNLPFDENKMGPNGWKNIVYAREVDLQRVVDLNFNLVSLANNHIFDLGIEGLRNTIRLLREKGIKFCGAGENIEDALKPCYVDIDGLRYAFIGCCFKGLPPWYVEAADNKKPGIFLADEGSICNVLRKAKAQSDYVIVLPHWGTEYDYVPPRGCVKLAKVMIDAGADAIFGSHTHIMNPKLTYKGKPIYFSLGNFLFSDFCLQVPRPIYYPQTREEVYRLPVVINYPNFIEEPKRVVWSKSSRRGVITILQINERINATCWFTYLNEENVITLYTGFYHYREKVRMWWFGLCNNSTIYHFIIRAYNSRYNIFRNH